VSLSPRLRGCVKAPALRITDPETDAQRNKCPHLGTPFDSRAELERSGRSTVGRSAAEEVRRTLLCPRSVSTLATTAQAAPAQPAQSLSPVQATAYGPNGGDNPQLAHLVLGGGHSAGWHTDWYSSPRFGNLYPGTGLLLKMDQTVTITSATVDLGSATGASLQLRVGNIPTMAALQPVARASGAGGAVRLNPSSPARGRYVLVWFTRLPTDSAGTFRASVHGVTLRGHG